MKRMRKTGRPLVLTVNGKAEVIVMDASAYQRVAEQLDTVASIRRGLAQAKKDWDAQSTIWNARREVSRRP